MPAASAQNPPPIDLQFAAAVWDESPYAALMLNQLSMRGLSLSEHDTCLFSYWCIRNVPLVSGMAVWDVLVDQRMKNSMGVAERYSAGEATAEEMVAAMDVARAALLDPTAIAQGEGTVAEVQSIASVAVMAAINANLANMLQALEYAFQLTSPTTEVLTRTARHAALVMANELRRRFPNPFR